MGYGLEGILTDGLSSLIIQNARLPRVKAGDMPGGIEAGVDALLAQLTLPEDQARMVAAKAQPAPASPGGGSIFQIVFFGLIFVMLFVVPMLRSARRRSGYRPSGMGPIVLWSVIDAMSRGRGGFGGGFGGGGGGFSGGGGSFGGGGSSGSW